MMGAKLDAITNYCTLYAESDYCDDFKESSFKMKNNIVYEVSMEMPGNFNCTSNYYFHYS
jgi:hypothetical protein